MKKTLAMVLAVVMAVSCCCVLFVSAEVKTVNLAKGINTVSKINNAVDNFFITYKF